MKRLCFSLIVLAALLAACAGPTLSTTELFPVPTVTPLPSTTPVPTSVQTPTPAATATSTAEPVERWSSTSPDGKWIAQGMMEGPFLAGDEEKYHYQLKVVSADRSIEWTAVDERARWGLGYTSPRPLHWSKDEALGTTALSTTRYLYFTNEPVPDGCAVFVNGSDLQRMDLITGQVQEILPRKAWWLSLSPDERQLAYVYWNGEALEIVLRTLTTGAERRAKLKGASGDSQAGNIVWSPDGNAFMLTVATHPCNLESWTHSIVRVDCAALSQKVLILEDKRLFITVEWPKAEQVLLKDKEGNSWWMDATTGQVVATKNATPLALPTVEPKSPAQPTITSEHLSDLPSGRLLLLRGNASPYELWTVRPDRRNAERAPIPSLELRKDVIPSPDGKSLLLIRSQTRDRITQRSLERYDLATGQTTVLVDAPITGTGVQEAEWSPGGSAIAFTSDAQNGQGIFDIWLARPDGTDIHPTTRFSVTTAARLNNEASWFPVPRAEAAGMVSPGAHTLQWSPTGEWIAFAYVADQRATPEIRLIRAADGTMHSIAIPPGPYRFDEFTWTADGQGLLYRDRMGHGRTWRIDLGDTSPALVYEQPIIGPWSPDRRQMALNVWPWAKQVEADSEIWLYDYASGQPRWLVRAVDLDAADSVRGTPRWSNPWLGTSQSPWSPDGCWLAFIAQRDDQSGDTTWIAATDGSALWPVAEGEIVAWLP
jgi:WD40-like Beta Propeller Repeat